MKNYYKFVCVCVFAHMMFAADGGQTESLMKENPKQLQCVQSAQGGADGKRGLTADDTVKQTDVPHGLLSTQLQTASLKRDNWLIGHLQPRPHTHAGSARSDGPAAACLRLPASSLVKLSEEQLVTSHHQQNQWNRWSGKLDQALTPVLKFSHQPTL